MSLCYSLALLFGIIFFEVAYEANASLDCMPEPDCTSLSDTPSLYYQYCCLSANNGRRIKMIEDNLVSIIVCPFHGLPESLCQGNNYYSCSDVLKTAPYTASGYYNLTLNNGSIVSVYCDMEGSNCNGTGGWMRIGYVNMTEPNATCPQGLHQYTIEGKTLCDRSHNSTSQCNATLFSSIGLNYTQVCGQVRGYELGHYVDSFYPNGRGGSLSIDGVYVDGVSITYGSNPRQHIWTYAAGYAEDTTDNEMASCPCVTGYPTPSFVGDDYYCEAGTIKANLSSGRLYPDDPLWDGMQCSTLESPCCNSTIMPWFVKSISQSTDDDIELRVCSSEGYPDEATPIDIIELYIR